jgi:hypothetical protein
MVHDHRTRHVDHAGVASVVPAVAATVIPTVVPAVGATVVAAMVRPAVVATAPVLAGMAAVMAAAVVVPGLGRGREGNSQRQRQGGKSEGPEVHHRESPAVGSETTIVHGV